MRVLLVAAVLVAGFAGGLDADSDDGFAPPDIPPNHSGCGYFYWDSGDLANGEAPGYRYRHCV